VHAEAAGVRKAPRQEIAVGSAPVKSHARTFIAAEDPSQLRLG
jgi:hypothetical protein